MIHWCHNSNLLNRRDAVWLIAETATEAVHVYSGRCRSLLSLLSLTRVMAVNTTDTLLLTAVACVSGNSGGKLYPAIVASQWKLQFLWCIVLNLAVDMREILSQWSAKLASLNCVGKLAGILNKYWFKWELSLSLFTDSHIHSSGHWNSQYLAPPGSWAGPGTGKTGDHNHRRLQIERPPTVNSGFAKGERGLVSEHVHSQLASLQPVSYHS